MKKLISWFKLQWNKYIKGECRHMCSHCKYSTWCDIYFNR